MVLQALFLDKLLGHGVAGCEEDRGGDALGEQWARGQLSLVPAEVNTTSFVNYFYRCCVNCVVGTSNLPAKHLG